MIESYLAIHQNVTRTLSVQQMIDCAENGNSGCDGGDACLLLEWLAQNKIPIRTEKEYPQAEDGMNHTCHMLLDNVTNDMDTYQIDDFTCNR